MIYKTGIISAVLLAMLAVCGTAGDLGTRLPYDVGDTIPDSIFVDTMDVEYEMPDFRYMSSFIKLYPFTIEGITYNCRYYNEKSAIASEFPRILSYIMVRDSDFVSPEGLKVGQPISKALPFSNGEVFVYGDTGKRIIKLPSGWGAVYFSMDDNLSVEYYSIAYFFKSPMIKS